MDDHSLRAEFHRAIDAVAPPAPWLFAAVREEMRHQRQEAAPRQRTGGLVTRPAWLLPVVAVLLAVAVVAALLFEARALQPRHSIPVKPPGSGGAGCPAWGANQSGGEGPPAGTMTSTTVGWSAGMLRTTDGGADWLDVSPPAMRADAPSGAGSRPYPPSYADFFLDSDHAWLARPYTSATSCFDHVGVFSTSDGGRSWTESTPVSAAVVADTSLQLLLDFIDPQHGWLVVAGMGRLQPDWFLYSTSNGGRDWTMVAPLPSGMSSFCSIKFISLTTGYIGQCRNTSGPAATLIATRDGGRTWDSITLPEPVGSQFTVDTPVFLDPNHGVVHVIGTVTQGNTMTPVDYLAATFDGGITWQTSPNLPAGFAAAFDFVDAKHIWVLLGDGRGGSDTLYRSADGGSTWTSVASGLPPIYWGTVVFIDAKHGFIIEADQQAGRIGNGPASMLVTTDGGAKWTSVRPRVR